MYVCMYVCMYIYVYVYCTYTKIDNHLKSYFQIKNLNKSRYVLVVCNLDANLWAKKNLCMYVLSRLANYYLKTSYFLIPSLTTII